MPIIISMKAEKTKLTKANSISESLRTTVPAGIARQFEMKEKDELEWKLETRDGRLIIVVIPIIK